MICDTDLKNIVHFIIVIRLISLKNVALVHMDFGKSRRHVESLTKFWYISTSSSTRCRSITRVLFNLFSFPKIVHDINVSSTVQRPHYALFDPHKNKKIDTTENEKCTTRKARKTTNKLPYSVSNSAWVLPVNRLCLFVLLLGDSRNTKGIESMPA